MRKVIVSILLFCIIFASSCMAQQIYLTKKNAPAAWCYNDIDMVNTTAGDRKAFMRLIDEGRVFLLAEGMQIIIIESTTYYHKVRMVGETFTFWVRPSAIQ